jgi:hypothetical protein
MNKLTTSLTAIALAAGFSLAAIAPASADQAAATRNEIIGGLALVAGIATAINVSNKNAEANQYAYGYNGNSYDGNGYQGNNRSDDGRRYAAQSQHQRNDNTDRRR